MKATFSIKPRGTELKALKAGRKKFTAKWKKQKIQTSGYQIKYSRSGKFRKAKIRTVKGNAKVKASVGRLKSGGRYYVKIRTYKNVSGKKFCSGWSKKLSVRVR